MNLALVRKASTLCGPLPEGCSSAADLLVAYLEQIGVEYVFGVPGGAIEPLYNALAASARRGGPRAVVARHEAGAAFMADGYARESGRIGVCCATSGPGATNLITGVACAHDNGVPLLAITGQPPLPSHGRRALQESACTGINVVGMFEHCSHFNSMVAHVEQLESKLVGALMRASQEPYGAAHLSIPVDVLRARVGLPGPSFDLRQRLRQAAEATILDERAIDRLVEELGQARKVVMLVGGGCGEAMGAILAVAEMLAATLVATPDGKGFVNPEHRLYRGVFGFAGHQAAHVAFSEPDVDLILAIGTSLGEWTSGGWSESVLNDRLVHVDVSQEHLMRSPMARLQVRGRILTVFERLLVRLDATGTAIRKPLPGVSGVEPYLDVDSLVSDAVPIKPQRLMFELGRRCPPHTRFLADAGNSTAWAVHCLESRDRRLHRAYARPGQPVRLSRRRHQGGWLRVTMDFAPMGWAIGGAVGTALADTHCPVVCLTGDGSYLMNGQEITVAKALGATVLFVILNDSALGMVKHGQRLAGAERIGFELPDVDYRRLAEAMDIPGYVIRSPGDLDCLDLPAILRRKGPTLLDVRIDGEEVPPMSLRMQSLGTAR